MNLHERQIAAHYLVLHADHPASTDLTAEHFRDVRIRQAWERARSTSGPVDTISLLGLELTQELSDTIVHAAEIPAHVDALKAEWCRHKAREALSHAADKLLSPLPYHEVQAVLGGLQGRLAQALAMGPHDSVPHSEIAMSVAQTFVTDLQADDRSIMTPWPGLNGKCPGLPFGKLTIIGGRSSEHKTTLARLIMHHAVAHYGLTGTFWTGEDSAEDISRRCVASECPSLTLGRFSAGRWSKDRKGPTQDELQAAFGEFERHRGADYWQRFRIEDQPFGDIDNVCAFIRQQHAKHGIRIFVGDFIQLIEKMDTKANWVSAMSKLCGIAKALDLVMIWTSQVDKVGTKESTESNRPPRGIDMLYGTALRQQAYAVLMVGTDEGRLRVVIDKHKSAKSGEEIILDIDAPHDRLGDYPEMSR